MHEDAERPVEIDRGPGSRIQGVNALDQENVARSEAQRGLANATGAAAATEAFATMAARIAALGTSHDREA